MSTQDFLSRTTFNNLEASIELALSQTEGFRDEAENFADLARRGIRLVGVVANLSSFPANPEDGDAVFVESETQIYFWDATSSTWKNSQIIGSAIWGNVQGTLSDQTDLQTVLDGKVENWGDIGGTLSTQTDLQTALDGKVELVPDVYTPEFIPQSGSFDTITYQNQIGNYIKFGKLCFVQIALSTSNVVLGSASGRVEINLPFPTPSQTARDQALSIARIIRWDFSTVPNNVRVFIPNGFNRIRLELTGINDIGVNWGIVNDMFAGENNTYNIINMNGVYEIDE